VTAAAGGGERPAGEFELGRETSGAGTRSWSSSEEIGEAGGGGDERPDHGAIKRLAAEGGIVVGACRRDAAAVLKLGVLFCSLELCASPLHAQGGTPGGHVPPGSAAAMSERGASAAATS